MALLNYVGFRSLACLMLLLTIMLFGLSNLTLPTISLSSSALFLPVNCMILALLASGGFFSRNALAVSETCNACVSVSISSDGNSSVLALRRDAELEGAIVVSCEYVEEKTIVCIDDRAFHEDSLVVCADDYSCHDDRSLVPCEDFAHENSCRELVPTLESVSSMESEFVGDDPCRSLVADQPSPRKKTKKTKKNSSFRRKKVDKDQDWIVRTTDRAVKVDLENLSEQEFNNVVSSFIDLRRQEWLLIGNAP